MCYCAGVIPEDRASGRVIYSVRSLTNKKRMKKCKNEASEFIFKHTCLRIYFPV